MLGVDDEVAVRCLWLVVVVFIVVFIIHILDTTPTPATPHPTTSSAYDTVDGGEAGP